MPPESIPAFPVVTAQEMKLLDQRASAEFLIPSLILMENAGRGIADLVGEINSLGTGAKSQCVPVPNILVCSGKGNNGGDGFVAARHLYNRSGEVTVLLLADPDALKGDALTNFKMIQKMRIPIHVIKDMTGLAAAANFFRQADVIVDALFGIGLNAPPAGIYKEAIERINQSGKTVVAVDIPSGLDTDTGTIHGTVVKANATGTFGFMKRGMTINDGPKLCGKVTMIDIGLPRGIL